MNAQQVKQLATKNLKGPVIEPFVKQIDEKIKLAAENGRFNIIYPFQGVQPYPSFEAQDAIYDYFSKNGFKVTHHPDPDPGHPASSSYTEISWRI
jgi:hypothetical protein